MEREIVFDSSTAILLAKINLLSELSRELSIIFPETVKEETTIKIKTAIRSWTNKKPMEIFP